MKIYNMSSLKEELMQNEIFGKYIQDVEVDESIKIDVKDKFDFFGAEVITKPIPSNIAFDILEDIFEILSKEYGFTTNYSTGFHINISNIYTEKKQPVDIVKLMLFLGESHELEKYNRTHNMYSVNLYELVRNHGTYFSTNMTDVEQFIAKTNELIKKENKVTRYLSFNPRTLDDGYMEFRIAGGKDYQKDIEMLRDSANRYVRCLHIACRPDLNKREYYKKATQLMHYAASQIHAMQDDSETIVSIMKKLELKFTNKMSYHQIKSVNDLELFHARGIMIHLQTIGSSGEPDSTNPLHDKSKPFFTVREKKVLSQIYDKYKDSPFIDEHMLKTLRGVI